MTTILKTGGESKSFKNAKELQKSTANSTNDDYLSRVTRFKHHTCQLFDKFSSAYLAGGLLIKPKHVMIPN